LTGLDSLASFERVIFSDSQNNGKEGAKRKSCEKKEENRKYSFANYCMPPPHIFLNLLYLSCFAKYVKHRQL